MIIQFQITQNNRNESEEIDQKTKSVSKTATRALVMRAVEGGANDSPFIGPPNGVLHIGALKDIAVEGLSIGDIVQVEIFKA